MQTAARRAQVTQTRRGEEMVGGGDAHWGEEEEQEEEEDDDDDDDEDGATSTRSGSITHRRTPHWCARPGGKTVCQVCQAGTCKLSRRHRGSAKLRHDKIVT